MAGIEDANVVDLVARDALGEYMVVMIETRRWGTDPQQPRQLKDKINAYASYILDGDLLNQYPTVAGHPVRIQLECPQQPSEEISAITEWAARQLGEYGVRFVVNVKG